MSVYQLTQTVYKLLTQINTHEKILFCSKTQFLKSGRPSNKVSILTLTPTPQFLTRIGNYKFLSKFFFPLTGIIQGPFSSLPISYNP